MDISQEEINKVVKETLFEEELYGLLPKTKEIKTKEIEKKEGEIVEKLCGTIRLIWDTYGLIQAAEIFDKTAGVIRRRFGKK